MSTNETSDSLPDGPLPPIEPDDDHDNMKVPLPGGVSARTDHVAELREPDDVADTDFGTLSADTDELSAAGNAQTPQSYVAVDLDQIRADIDVARASGDKGEAMGSPADHMAAATDDQLAETEDGSAGLPPEDPPDGPAASDEPSDPEEELERQAARAEAGYLITNIGRFTHGPDSEPLMVENDDSTIATSMATAKDRIGDIGLTPETVIGRKAHTNRTVPDLDLQVRVEGEALNEEILPIVEALDEAIGEGRTPIARVNIVVKPLGGQYADGTEGAERSLKNPSTHATVWVRSGLRSDVYMDTFGMDREAGARVEAFLDRLGFRDAQVLTPEEGEYDDVYYTNTRSDTLMQVNRFMREVLG